MARKPSDPDLDQLLSAVCQHPDEDVPRLEYADYLERTGNPFEGRRAEFIRVQCELARGNFSDDRWGQLLTRQEELSQDRDRWDDELPVLRGVRWNTITYARGFVWGVWCDDVEAFQKNATAIFLAAPVQSLSFVKISALRPVVDVREFSSIYRLIVEERGLGPADAVAIASSENAKNLRALHISGNHLGDTGAMAIAESPFLRSLDNLDVSENAITDTGVTRLANSPVVAKLTHLGLAGCPLTDVGAMALASSPHLNRLTGLTLWECAKIGPEGKKVLRARFGDAVSFED